MEFPRDQGRNEVLNCTLWISVTPYKLTASHTKPWPCRTNVLAGDGFLKDQPELGSEESNLRRLSFSCFLSKAQKAAIIPHSEACSKKSYCIILCFGYNNIEGRNSPDCSLTSMRLIKCWLEGLSASRYAANKMPVREFSPHYCGEFFLRMI